MLEEILSTCNTNLAIQSLIIFIVVLSSSAFLVISKRRMNSTSPVESVFDRNGGSLNSSLSWFEEDVQSRSNIHPSHLPKDTTENGENLNVINADDDEAIAETDESFNRTVSERSIEVSMGTIPPRKRYVVLKGRKTVTKTVYLIRHAESAENHRLACLSRSLKSISKLRIPSTADITASMELIDVPAQIDSDVSPAGYKQIEQLAGQLAADNFVVTNKVTLIAHSPLKRARQTCQGMLGYVAEPTKDGNQENYDPRIETEKGNGEEKDINKPRVVELDFLKERTPTEWLPYGNGKLAERIDEFESWLNQQPEDVIAIVGHSQYFKFMLGLSYKFGNCDVWKFEYVPDANLVSTGMTVTYSRRDDFENYDGPQIEACAGKGVNIDDEISEQSPIPSKSSKRKEIPYQREDSLKVDLPRGWGKMECMYKYEED